MNIDNLLQMANRIGQFFETQPDRSEALEGLAQHLRNFWAPPMRQAVLAHLDSEHGQGLSPIVVEALHIHRETLS